MKSLKQMVALALTMSVLSLRAEVTPIFEGWLTTEDQVVWENVRLELLSDFHGTLGGKSGLNGCTDGAAYYAENSGSSATLQFQYQDNTTVKGVLVQFTQVGDDVYGKSSPHVL